MAIVKNGSLVKPPLTRKDHEEINVVVYQKDGVTPRDISNDSLVFEARVRTADAEPVLRKTSGNPGEILKTEPVNGKARIIIEKDDLLFMTRGGTLKCSLEVSDINGRPNTTLFDLEITYRS